MKIQSELHLATHPETGEPHAMGLMKIPLESLSTVPQAEAIYNALPKDAQAFVQKEGNLAISHDFTFSEEYKDGVGLVIKDLSLDVSRLQGAEKEQVGAWMREQYGVAALDDRGLQQASNSLREHITTDMTAAGMSKDYLVTLITEQTQGVPQEDREAYLPSEATAQKMANSLTARLGLSATPDLTPGSADYQKLSAYHDNVVTMGERWPSAKGENYGREAPGQGEVIFFKGFEAEGETILKSGPYAYSCAWPSNVEVFDQHGIARDADGKAIKASAIKADEDYVYQPKSVLKAEFSGQQAVDRIHAYVNCDKEPAYNGYIGANCIGVSGTALLGKEMMGALASLPGAGSKGIGLWQDPILEQAQQNPLLQSANISTHQVDVSTTSHSLDHNGLHAASTQVATQQQGRTQQQAPTQAPAAKAAPAPSKSAPPAGLSAAGMAELKGVIGNLSAAGNRAPSDNAAQAQTTKRGMSR